MYLGLKKSMQPIALILARAMSGGQSIEEFLLFGYLSRWEFGSVGGNVYLCRLKINKTI